MQMFIPLKRLVINATDMPAYPMQLPGFNCEPEDTISVVLVTSASMYAHTIASVHARAHIYVHMRAYAREPDARKRTIARILAHVHAHPHCT